MGIMPEMLSASGLAQGSVGAGNLATGANAAASLFSGIGASQQYSYMAQVSKQNADAALMAGQNAESQSKGHYSALEAEQKAGQAANGVDVNAGSTVAVRESTERVSAMDAALIHYNAAREAYGQETQAGLYKKAAGGELAKGLMGATNSILSGSNSLNDKWLTYQMSGALMKPGSNPMTLPGPN